jgi:hypothetical protein
MLYESRRMRWKEHVFDLEFFDSKLQGERQFERPRRMCVWESNVKMVLKDTGSE